MVLSGVWKGAGKAMSDTTNGQGKVEDVDDWYAKVIKAHETLHHATCTQMANSAGTVSLSKVKLQDAMSIIRVGVDIIYGRLKAEEENESKPTALVHKDVYDQMMIERDGLQDLINLFKDWIEDPSMTGSMMKLARLKAKLNVTDRMSPL